MKNYEEVEEFDDGAVFDGMVLMKTARLLKQYLSAEQIRITPEEAEHILKMQEQLWYKSKTSRVLGAKLKLIVEKEKR